MAKINQPAGEEYRKLLKKMVAAAGQEIIERADDIVGNGSLLSDLSITVHFQQPLEQVPELEITRCYICRHVIDTMMDDAITNKRAEGLIE